MTAEGLLSDLRARGVRLDVAGERLRWWAPSGAMTVAVLRDVQAHKPELLLLLREEARRDAQRLRAAQRIFDAERLVRDADGQWQPETRCSRCGTVRDPAVPTSPVCHPPASGPKPTPSTPEVA